MYSFKSKETPSSNVIFGLKSKHPKPILFDTHSTIDLTTLFRLNIGLEESGIGKTFV